MTNSSVDRTAARLRSAILSDRWSPGDRLPPERTLALELEVSRPSLRSALSRLSSEGLVRSRQGSGVTVLDWRVEGDVSLLPHLVAAGRMDLLEPFLELRRAIAVDAVALVCERASEAELDDLAAFAQRLAVESDRERLVAGNLEFSRRVVRLAGNLPMNLLFNTVARVYQARPELARALLVDDDLVRQSFPAIVALLRQRDPQLARAAVRSTLEAIDARTTAILETA